MRVKCIGKMGHIMAFKSGNKNAIIGLMILLSLLKKVSQ
jgi:hypothetical protein